MRILTFLAAVLCQGAELAETNLARHIESLGGVVSRAAGGTIISVSLARTWATDADVERLAQLKDLKRLDLSFTYVSDRGVERLQQLRQLEELTLDTAEFITDAAISYLRSNRALRRLVLRGTDVTDISLPYIAVLTELRVLDLSYTMLGDGGLESLPALAKLEELYLGGTRITGINFHFLKLLPKLKVLRLGGIQRRNGGACWTPTITDRDLDPIALLPELEELHLGVGLGLGRVGARGPGARGEGNCRLTGGIHITDLGVAKLTKLKKLRRLDLSGADITPASATTLTAMPQLERLSLWNCRTMDDAAAAKLDAPRTLASLDLSDTPIGDAAMDALSRLPRLQQLYLTNTRVTATGLDSFRRRRPATFVSWAVGDRSR
ncbi:MAG: hypothetical protein HY820_15350 [Acidobacteria bacterium]|nr:hypothetical protein [Acidobacteriota bacterium]